MDLLAGVERGTFKLRVGECGARGGEGEKQRGAVDEVHTTECRG
jgi:hypothetical protein